MLLLKKHIRMQRNPCRYQIPIFNFYIDKENLSMILYSSEAFKHKIWAYLSSEFLFHGLFTPIYNIYLVLTHQSWQRIIHVYQENA